MGEGFSDTPSSGRPPRLALEPSRYVRIYAVGDVHGCLDQLLALEEVIRKDAEAVEGPKLIVMTRGMPGGKHVAGGSPARMPCSRCAR